MTERAWMKCLDPGAMLRLFQDKTSDRKLRLLAVALCRVLWERLPDERSNQAIDVAERFADRLLKRKRRHRAYRNATAAAARLGWGSSEYRAASAAVWATETPERLRLNATWFSTDGSVKPVKTAALVRCIFGNPFQAVKFDARWLSLSVRQLAVAYYGERRFDALPYLADALQEAGCDQKAILNHCRQPGVHVRGCWALDLVLGGE